MIARSVAAVAHVHAELERAGGAEALLGDELRPEEDAVGPEIFLPACSIRRNRPAPDREAEAALDARDAGLAVQRHEAKRLGVELVGVPYAAGVRRAADPVHRIATLQVDRHGEAHHGLLAMP